MRVVPYVVGEELPAIDWHLQSFAERSRGAATVQDFKDSIAAGKHQLWTVQGAGIWAAILTEVSTDRNETVRITHCAGQSHADWCGLVVDTVRAWANERGSKAVAIVCRRGWERPLRELGFKVSHVVMELE